MKSPIANYFLYVSIDGNFKKLGPKLLLKVSSLELHNIMVSPPEERLKEATDIDNNIIISDSTLCNIIPPKFKNMTS